MLLFFESSLQIDAVVWPFGRRWEIDPICDLKALPGVIGPTAYLPVCLSPPGVIGPTACLPAFCGRLVRSLAERARRLRSAGVWFLSLPERARSLRSAGVWFVPWLSEPGA